MNMLEHISFKYKLFIPLLFTLGMFGMFLIQNYKLSGFIEGELLSIRKQEIWLNTITQSISKNINDLKNNFVNKALQDQLNRKELLQAQERFYAINSQIKQITESKFLHNEAIKQSLLRLQSRLQGYYAILLDLPETYKESPEDAIYTIISLGSVYNKIQDELNMLLTASKEQLNHKIISIKEMVSNNRSKMIWTAFILMGLLIIFELFLIREILGSIQILKNVNKSFHDFLYGKVSKVKKIDYFPKDEIGQILYMISDNTKQAEVLISKERELTHEINKLNNTLEQRVQSALVEITTLNKEIEDTQREVIFTMGAIGESRSKETGNHVRRVAEYSKLLAILYGLDEKEANLIKEASPMHDIGKVAIPDHILNKPGRLTNEEFAIMQTHAQIGYDMLKHSNRPILKAAAIIAYQHHEKYNGTGYPNGLKGDEIHIYGAITAIADVFDALGSDRVYKKAWEHEKIIKLFQEEKGKHFHPELTQIFLDNIDQFLKIKKRYEDHIQMETAKA
jgi:response regulator RpfG family c-di-GMP phosphodiesterase